VFLGRRPAEPPDECLKEFYRRLLQVVSGEVLESGAWGLCECSGWADNPSWRGLVAWCWRSGANCCMVVVNLTGVPAQGLVRFAGNGLRGGGISLQDVFSGAVYDREAAEMTGPGLFVDLPAWGYHVFTFRY
jgi:hypothetical protein